MAARVERQARGGDIVVLRDVLPPELIERAVARSPIRLETFTAVLPGIRGERELVRLTPAPEGAVASSSELGSAAPAAG